MLGAEFNQLEVDDYKIKSVIETISLPSISLYSPDWIQLDLYESDIIEEVPRLCYKIKTDRFIIDVKDVVFRGFKVIGEINQMSQQTDAVGIAMDNYERSMGESLRAIKTWEFKKPNFLYTDRIITDQRRDMVVKLGVSHLTPETIPTDLFIYFRDKCLADLIGYLLTLRTKFSNLQTPYGQLELNVEGLRQQKMELDQRYNELMNDLPPDNYLYFV